MDPSHDAQDRARGSERYHTCADGQRGLDGGQNGKTQYNIFALPRSELGQNKNPAPMA